MNYVLRTTVHGPIIKQEVAHEVDLRDYGDLGVIPFTGQALAQWVMDTRQAAIREALIKMGWTPPPLPGKVDSAV